MREQARKKGRKEGRKKERKRKKERRRKKNAPTETGPLPQSHAQDLFCYSRAWKPLTPIPFRRWSSQDGRKRSGTPNIHLNSGAPCPRRAQRCSSRRVGQVSTIRPTNGWHWSPRRFLEYFWESYLSSRRTKSWTLCAEWGVIHHTTQRYKCC